MLLLIADDVPRKSVPLVTWLIIAGNVAAFFLYALKPGYGEFVSAHGFVPARWTWDQLFSSMFLHADLLHLAGNMLFLGVLGDNVEDRYGHLTYALFYVLSGIAAAFAHFIFSAASQIPCIGASGAVSGVLGAFLVLFPFHQIKVLFFVIPMKLPAFVVIGLWVGTQWLLKMRMDEGEPMSVAVWAHLGGFAFGFAVTLILRMTAKKRKSA